MIERVRVLATLSSYTIKEYFYEKVYILTLLLSFLLFGTSILLKSLSYKAHAPVLLSLGLGGMSFSGIFLAIFMGIGLIKTMHENKSLEIFLTQKVGRMEFFLGRFLGGVFLQVINMGVLTLSLLLLFFLEKISLNFLLVKALVLCLMESIIVLSVTLTFSLFLKRFLTLIATLSFIVASHSIWPLLVKLDEGLLKDFLQVISPFFPDMRVFSLRDYLAYSLDIPEFSVAFGMMHGLIYLAATILLSMWIMQKKDIL